MSHALKVALIALGLLGGMGALLEAGRRLGARRIAKDSEASAGINAIDGAVFGLMGLLIAFTFSGAAVRFDARRQLIIEEANAIGTAYLRLDLLPPGAQPALRESFRQYIDTRLQVFRKIPDISAARLELAKATQLQRDIWRQAVTACQTEGTQAATILLLPALNAMIDITTTRTMTAQMHPPLVIFALLFMLALASALLAGYDMAVGRSRSWIHMLGFATVVALSAYVILDLEYPRLGLIRIDAFDHVLVEVRESMN